MQILAIQGVLVSYDVRSDAAQAFIDAHLSSRVAVADASRVVKPISRKPGRIETFSELLKPFLTWEPCLKFPNRDIFECLRHERRYEAVTFPRCREEELWSRRSTDLMARNLDHTRVCRNDPEDNAAHDDPVAAEFLKVFLADTPLVRSLDDRTRGALIRQLASACSAIVRVDAEYREFESMFGLWLHGNYPLGLDVEDRLLILVAD